MFRKLLFFALLLAASAAARESDPKKKMLSELEFIHHTFDVKYAPLDWKKNYNGFDLEEIFGKAKRRVIEKQDITVKQFQQILRDLFNATCDYHVGIYFYSTESATLPFLVKGAEGRYFLCYIDRFELPYTTFPFKVGDEVVSFNGKPIHDVIEALRKEELGEGNSIKTDQALAQLLLTQRMGSLGNSVPSGEVTLGIIKKVGDGRVNKVDLQWQYTPERVSDVSKLNPTAVAAYKLPAKKKRAVSFNKDTLLSKLMIYPRWNCSYVGNSLEVDNPYYRGSKKSYIPPLGKKVWKASEDSYFDAYIFKTAAGHKIGYIRIPHYMADEEELEEFIEHIQRFESQTDALVVDQINNPGGSIFYAYAILSCLADKPLIAPKEHITLTQDEIYEASTSLPLLDEAKTLDDAKDLLGETLGGYPVTLETLSCFKKFFEQLLGEWERGKLYTDSLSFFGIEEIKPHPRGHYSKPILFITDPLDFSCGDFVPAILQDNNRAVIFGEKTAGAGGYVLGCTYHNQSGVQGFSLTGSHAERKDLQPIENLGVTPDISYELTVDDLQYHYTGYVAEIVKSVESLIEKK